MKKIALLLTIIIATMCLSACGVSNTQFRTKVRESKIIGDSSPLWDGIETISDFEEKVESYDENNIGAMTTWNDGKVKQDHFLIKAFEKETNFIYDNKKTYGYMTVCIVPNYKASGEWNYWYLFSLDKSGDIKAEATATSTEDLFAFNDMALGELAVKDKMMANILYLEMLKGLHTEK